MDRVLAGRYELEVPLGRGGSGEVWRGRDMATLRPVAVKLVELSQIDDPGTLAETIGRFRREATVIGALRHENVVAAIDAGRIANQLFMVMELAPGISLAAMMDERGARGMGLFPVSSVLRMAEQVCVGLAVAHEAGVVHRDIKPSNLMVTPRLDVKIIDFGIARLLAENAPRLTLPAQTVGTIAYISPEQAQGLAVDGRADLYSLGCVLYQLLSGRPPFFSTLPGALLMMQVMDRPTPLGAIRPDLPAGLAELIGELLEKDPSERPATAAEVVDRIAEIRRALGAEEPEREADWQTVGAFGARDAMSETRWEPVVPQSGAPTVRTPDWTAMAQPPMTRPPASNGAGAPPWEVAGSTTRPPGSFPVPAQPGPPVRSAPQAATDRTDSVPGWPGVRDASRPKPVWRGVVITLVIASLVAAVGVYFWERTHQPLRITNVKVTTASQSVGCDGTAHLIGTISTNGRGGQITYEWIRGGNADAPAVINNVSGREDVRVKLDWAFHGRGTGKAVAELRVLNPRTDTEASITFPYSCPR
ncbi:MAG: protein kinase domain-containing protein [Trebonia sp.]